MALGEVEALEATIGGNRAFCFRHGIGYCITVPMESLVKAADASCRILKALRMLYYIELHIIVRSHIHIIIM